MAKHDVRNKQGRFTTAPATAPTAAPGKPNTLQVSDVIPSLARLGTTALATTVGGLIVMLGGSGAAIAAPQRMDATNTVLSVSSEKCNAAQRKAKKAQKRSDKTKVLNKNGKATSKKVKRTKANAQKRARQAVKACAVAESRVTDPFMAATAEYERTLQAEPEIAKLVTAPGKIAAPGGYDEKFLITEVTTPVPGLVIQRSTGVETGNRKLSYYTNHPFFGVGGGGVDDAVRTASGYSATDALQQFRTNGADKNGFPIYEVFDSSPAENTWVRVD